MLTDKTHKALDELNRVGLSDASYIIENQNIIYESLASQFDGKVELHDIRTVKDDRLWSLIKDKDHIIDDIKKYETENVVGGLYLIFKKDITFPFQSCMILSNDSVQRLHNLIIVNDNVKAFMITGCTAHTGDNGGEHRSITEIILGRNASLNYTMIHDWGEDTKVYPRTFVNVGENSKFVYNYVNLNRAAHIQTMPLIRLERNAVAESNSLVYVDRSMIDMGTVIKLGENAKGRINLRSIFNTGELISRGKIIGNKKSVGHNACDVLMLNDGVVESIPELVSHSKDAQLSHEAAIGKLSEKEVEYLMTRGMTEDEAISLIVHGFLDTKILGLSPEIETEIKKLLDKLKV